MKERSKDFSIIDKDLTIEGTLSCRGKLVIKGNVRGTLDGETIVIAQEGAVYAKTKVARMTVAGIFEGDIEATESLTILSTGKCTGTVVCNNLMIEAKGILNARVTCLSAPEKEAVPALLDN